MSHLSSVREFIEGYYLLKVIRKEYKTVSASEFWKI